VSQNNSDDGGGYPQADSGGAAGPGSPASPSASTGAQPQNNPALGAPENATQQAGTEATASSSTPTGAQPQSNPTLRAPENATQQARAEVVANSNGATTAQSLINQSSTETTVPESQRIPVDRIDPFPYQFRQTFDEAKLRELSESMRQVGLKQPIFVRPIVDRFQVVSGERRLRAAKLLGWTSISAVVQNLSNLDAAIGGLVENVQREDLNPIERARAFKQLSEPPFDLSLRDIGKRTAQDHSVVLRAMELLNQPAQIQELLSRASISPKHVRALSAIKRDSERAKLAEQAAAEHWTAQETEKRAREIRRSQKSEAQEPAHEPNHGDLPAWDWLHRLLEILRTLTLLRRLGKWLLAFMKRLIPSGDGLSSGGFIPPARDITEPPKEDVPSEHSTSPRAKTEIRG